MEPKYEKINPSFGSSFTYKKFSGEIKTNSLYWHFHPEYEIVYVSHGSGHRKVGDHFSEYHNGDLILVGPNIPHLGFAQEVNEHYEEIVVQMKEHFLGRDFFEIPEMKEVKKLFERANTGLAFQGDAKKEIGERLMKMSEVDNFSKMTELLIILQIMAYTKEATPLNVNSIAVQVRQTDQERMQILNEFIEENYHRKFNMEEVADKVNMTVPSLCRLFKNLTHRTFMEYVTEYRVAIATRLLSQKHLSVAAVSFESGFNNLSHFNKKFKALTGQTPTAFRKNMVNFVEAPLKT